VSRQPCCRIDKEKPTEIAAGYVIDRLPAPANRLQSRQPLRHSRAIKRLRWRLATAALSLARSP